MPVPSATVERIRSAFASAQASGDLTPLRSVMSPRLGWAAVKAGAGNCHSREQVLGVWAQHLAEHGLGRVEEIAVVGDRLLVVLRAKGARRPLAHVFSLWGGRITQIQDYPDREQALAALTHEVPVPD